MKYSSTIIFNLIILSLLFLITYQVEFKKDLQKIEVKNTKQYSFIANYSLETEYKYLYISPKNKESNLYKNKAIVRIYFKQISSKSSNEETSINYLNSDYSTIDFNSGLFIEIKDLKENSASVLILSYETINLLEIEYKYTNNVFFPKYSANCNYQLNQFILKKGKYENIEFTFDHEDDDYLLIFSKTSLRNLDIKVTHEGKDVTETSLAYLYPNGCSVFMDKSSIINPTLFVYINNKNNFNETISLGYMHHRGNPQFPNNITNGFQLYLEGNNNRLAKLYNEGNRKYEQYFTYQIFSKTLIIEFIDSARYIKETLITEDYNSVFHYNINFEGEISFDFEKTPQRSALYIQYLDFNENIITQKSLQPLVTGVPKSMIIPDGKSLYHFLPVERESNNLFYYLRAKTNEKLYVSFEICTSYPENCNFTGNRNNTVEAIENIGLWYTLPTNRSQLQLIYVYCEKECAYDILMAYDDDPLFLFPDNDYTKFVGDSGKDMLVLPVFEYFEKINTQLLYIDLTIISGKVELNLKNGRNGKEVDYKVTKIGNRLSYSIKFSKGSDYYKKEIYAVVEQNNNYKNSIYNINYGVSNFNSKILKNNIINMELLTVPEINKEGDNSKTFTFINKNNKFYVSISTNTCKIVVKFNSQTFKENYYFHQVIEKAGSYNFTIYLVRDEKYCTAGVEEEVILFAYDSNNANILLSENILINSTISNFASFIYLFKPKSEAGSDNSFNIEVERLNKNSLLFNYQLKRVSFNGLNNRKISDTLGQKIILKNLKYISNEQIKKICGSLKSYEVCSLTMNLISDSSSQFSLKLMKNDFYDIKNLTSQTLISSVNSKNIQYFYIDINKNYNIRLFINSFGQDLNYKYELIKERKDHNDILPLKDDGYYDGLNFHQKTILKNEFSKCNTFCRLYIGVKSSKFSNIREGNTLFSIGYQSYDDETSEDINLPLNYFFQYTFEGNEEVNYVLSPFEDGNFFFELYIIKQNETDESEATAYISDSPILTSSVGKIMKNYKAGNIKVNIKMTKGNKFTFKFRISSIGQQQIIPMISSYGEKCLFNTCYYLLDDLSSEKLSYINDDDDKKFVYFYIPEEESSSISYKLLKYNEDFSTTGDFNNTSTDLMKRKNWLQIPITYNEHSVIIKLENAQGLSLCATNYNKPNIVTLNYGEKRMFTIQRKILDNIIFNINNSGNSGKCKIKLHAIKGNGIFTFNNEIYPLGFENAYKEDISIIIAGENKINLKAINEKNGIADEDDDFVFTIEYSFDISSQFLYEINYDKINSFKFYQKNKIDNINFYLNFASGEANDLNMNIKIYSDESIYNINSYFVNNEFIQKILKETALPNNDNSAGEIKTFIQGGKPKDNNFTFSKLEISSDILKKQNNKNNSFIYINFKLKENQKKDYYNVKIDLYPYNINNRNTPLSRNHLFIQKIPSNAQNYKLFLAKSDIYYNEAIKINYVSPLLKTYKYFITHTEKGNDNPTENDKGLKINKKKKIFVPEEISIDFDSDLNKKNLTFNLVNENKEEFKEDLFIFSYKNTISDEEGVVYTMPTNLFEVQGNSKNLNYTFHSPAPLLKGNTILIIRIYKQDDIKDLLNIDKDIEYSDDEDNDKKDIHYYLPLYLLFSDIKPIYTKYEVLNINPYGVTLKTSINNIKHGGDLYLTAICIVEDNEREIYFAYKGIKKNIENAGHLQDLLDYMEDHIFATIIILIVIIMIIGMLINICRAERKSGRVSSVKVEIDGKLMEDKAD